MVDRVTSTARCSLPVFPDWRTSSKSFGMSQPCQEPTGRCFVQPPSRASAASILLQIGVGPNGRASRLASVRYGLARSERL